MSISSAYAAVMRMLRFWRDCCFHNRDATTTKRDRSDGGGVPGDAGVGSYPA